MNFDNDSDSDNYNDSDNNDTTTMKTKNNNSNINDISTIFSPTTTKNYKTVAETNRLGLLLAAKIDELTNERNEWHQQYDNIKSKYDHSIKENGILKLQIKAIQEEYEKAKDINNYRDKYINEVHDRHKNDADKLRNYSSNLMKDNMTLKMYISRLESELTMSEIDKKNSLQLIQRYEIEIDEMRKERTTLHGYQLKYKLESQDNIMTTLHEVRQENKRLQEEQMQIAREHKKSRKYIRKLLSVIHLYEDIIDKHLPSFNIDGLRDGLDSSNSND